MPFSSIRGRAGPPVRGLLLLLSLLNLLALPRSAAAASAAGLGDLGPYQAGWRSVEVERQNGTSFPALLYYPASSTGERAPYDNSGRAYPAIAFAHGYPIPPSYYHSTLSHLASWGYFVIAPASWLGLEVDRRAFGNDLSAALTYLETENKRSESPLYGQVDATHFGMSGHSMGGGVSIVAAAADARVKAVVTLAAVDGYPSPLKAVSAVQAPMRFIVGTEDTLVPAADTQEIFAQAEAPRQFTVIQWGWHCGFMDEVYPSCDVPGLIPAIQLRISHALLVEFFNLYLHEDQSLWQQVWGPELGERPLVETQAYPGVALSTSPRRGQGRPGQVMHYTLTVANTGPRPASYRLSVEGQAWPVKVTPDRTPLLAPGAAARLDVAAIVGERGSDTALISAVSDADGATRAFTHITTGAR